LPLDDAELLALDARGLFPGPDEEEEAFCARVRAAPLPLPGTPLPEEHWEGARQTTRRLYGCAVDWVPACYSNRRLPWWQGAAAWICGTRSFIQLREGLRQGRYLGIYSRDEVLAHEAAHACRSAFSEPRFEEVFAYQTSKSAFRRYAGPLFQRPWEAAVWMALAAIAFWTPLPLLAGCAACLGRLIYYQRALRLCLKRLASQLRDPSQALAVAFRLTDREILQAARGRLTPTPTLRWRLLRFYFCPAPVAGRRDV
jgi:hypothetical protein